MQSEKTPPARDQASGSPRLAPFLAVTWKNTPVLHHFLPLPNPSGGPSGSTEKIRPRHNNHLLIVSVVPITLGEGVASTLSFFFLPFLSPISPFLETTMADLLSR